MDVKKKFVILRSKEYGDRFFSNNNGGDPTRLLDGTIAYEIIGYADTVSEAQIKLFGRSYTDKE